MLLDGIRVVDFSQYIPGSYASLRLAEMGAEVIKIEPINGEVTRYFGKEKNATGVVFAANNRKKKSITINLKKEEGARLARELIEQADVVIESFRSGVMKRFNLDYETIKKYKKDIIYLSLSGYGQEGVMSDFGSHDLNYLALSGVLSQLRDEGGKPVMPKLTFADIIGGMAASERVLGALFKRERTGEGEFIDLALMNAILSLMNINLYTNLQTGKDNVISQLDRELISYNIYQTKDGRYVSFAALEEKFWKNFCIAVDHEEWIPEHLTTKSEDNQVYKKLEQLFLSRTLEEWTAFSLEVDCCLAPILEVGELKKHPYIIENKLLEISGTAPELGEDTLDIMQNILKKSEKEIIYLKENKVI